MFKAIVFIFSWIALGASPALAGPMMSVQVSPQSPVFKIKLDANPTTGFTWQVQSMDNDLFQFVKSEYKVSNPKLIGSPGVNTMIFKLKKLKKYPPSSIISLSYSRPWESDSGSTQQVKVLIGASDQPQSAKQSKTSPANDKD